MDRAGALRRWWVLPALYVVLAVLVTWPLTAHLGGSLTFGGELARTVPLLNLWTLEWNQQAIGELYAGYWDAPIFHPVQGAFALSEPQPLTGLAYAPLGWLSGNPVLAYNLVALAILALNGLAGARLARTLGAGDGPAALIGALAVGLPFVAHQMGVLQLTVVFPLLLLVEAILRWAPGGGSRPGALVGLWLAVAFLTCGYYGLFAIVGIGLASLVLARRSWFTRRRLPDLAVGLGVFAVLALPVVLGQAQYTGGYERSDQEIRELSAGFGDYWRLDRHALGRGVAPWVRDVDEGHGLYPGTVLLALALAGLVLAARRARGSQDVDERRRPWFLATGVLVAWLLSGGLKLDLGGFRPYDIVRALVPGFGELRNPARFAVLGELFLLGLAAYGLAALWRWRGRAGPLVATALIALAVAETSIAPVRLFDVDPEARWAQWLEDRAGPSGRVTAFVPFPGGGLVSEYQETAARMVQTVNTGTTSISGYSGLFPPSYQVVTNAMYGYPSSRGDAALRARGVHYVVVATRWLAGDPRRRAWMTTRHRRVYDDGDTAIFALRYLMAP
jgi:hypothetical protein